MCYSKTHQRFSELLEEQEALTNPEKYLGPNWEDVLNFWIYAEGLSEEERKEMDKRFWSLDDDFRYFTEDAAQYLATEVVDADFSEAAWRAAWTVTGLSVFAWATLELIGLLKLEERVNPHLAYSCCRGEEIVSFSVRGGTLSILNEIRDNYNLNRFEIIRRSIALFFIAKREQQKGNRLAVIDSAGNFISDIHSF